MFELAGMPVRETVHAVSQVRVREHVKRPGQSENYHRRIDKKWRKRFGMKTVPAMYKIGAGMFGREVLIVHPDLMPKLRSALSPNQALPTQAMHNSEAQP